MCSLQSHPEALYEYHVRLIGSILLSYISLAPRSPVRVYADISIITERRTSAGEVVEGQVVIILPSTIVLSESDVSTLNARWARLLQERLETAIDESTGSGWVISRVDHFKLVVMKNIHHNTYGCYAKLPNIRGSNLIYNPRSNGNRCVLMCLAADKILSDDLSKRYHSRRLDQMTDRLIKIMKFISLPTKLLREALNPINEYDLRKLESHNGVRIFIYKLTTISRNKTSRYVLSLSRAPPVSISRGFRDVSLLSINDNHVCLIRDFTAFIMRFKRIRSDRFEGRRAFHQICNFCLTPLRTPDIVSLHRVTCSTTTEIIYPPENNEIKFKHYGRGYIPALVLYYDFESLLVQPPNTSSHRVKQYHIPHAVAGLFVHGRDNRSLDKMLYLGSNCVDHFISWAITTFNHLKSNLPNYPINLSRDQEERHKRANYCSYCRSEFKNSSDKHCHHDHSIRLCNYLASLCRRCNIQQREQHETLTCVAHNSSYDLGLILKNCSLKLRTTILPKAGAGKYYCVRIGPLRFVDSLAFTFGSLSKLANAHIDQNLSLAHSRYLLGHMPNDAQSILLSGKGIFPYDFLSDANVLLEKSLPPINKFYSILTGESVTQTEYERAQRVWKVCGCKTLRDYLEIYLLCDLGLLADIMTSWRRLYHSTYRLDPLQYVSLPSFAYDSFLLKTGAKLRAVSDQYLNDLIRKNIRGGFSSCVRNFFKSGDNNHLLYLDFNSLYASAMMERLPTGEFYELGQGEIESLKRCWANIDVKHGEVGYYVLVDIAPLEWEVAEMCDEYPLLLNHLEITPSMISPFSKNLLKEHGRNPLKSVTKLAATHLGANEILLSLELLQVLMRQGVKVTKIHRAYKFKQEAFLAPFIQDNILARSQTDDALLKSIYKLVNNSIYGKMLMNETKHNTHVSFCRDAYSFIKNINKSTFKSFTPLGADRSLVHHHREKINLSQPNQIGFSILEKAKTKNYTFWYETVKHHYGTNAQLYYVDTDSFIFSLKTTNLDYELTQGPLSKVLDRSNFPPSHPLYDASRKGHLNYLKIETGALKIIEGVFLRPKLYSLKLEDNSQMAGAKGVAQREKAKLDHETFKACHLYNSTVTTRTSNICNIAGQLSTVQGLKIGLTCYDDKRFYLSNGLSVAYGHPACLMDGEMEIETGGEREDWSLEDETNMIISELAHELYNSDNDDSEDNVEGVSFRCYAGPKDVEISSLLEIFQTGGETRGDSEDISNNDDDVDDDNGDDDSDNVDEEGFMRQIASPRFVRKKRRVI